MRNLLLILILSFSLNVSGQINSNYEKVQFSQEDYLIKSKKQKKIANTLLYTGLGTIAVGLIGVSATSSDTGWPSHEEIAFAFTAAGGSAICLSSIPFYISSSSNAKKAAKLSLANQKIILPKQDSFAMQAVPSVSLKIIF